jgi:hypothetical protein
VKKLLIGFLATIVSLVVVFWVFIDLIVGTAIEDGATHALGVETRVGFARLRFLAGDLRLNNVQIGNPPGFEEPYFLAVDRAEVAANLLDLRNEVVELPLILLEGVDVVLERDGKWTNFDAILAHMDSFEEGEPAPETDDGTVQRFVVRRLLIRDVTARVEWNAIASKQTQLELEIPEIELRDLGEEGSALTTAELSNLVMKAILGSISRYGGDLPGAVIAGLDGGLRGVGRLSDVVVRGATGTLRDTASGILDGNLRDVGAAAADGLGAVSSAAGKAIGGFFGQGDEE